MSTQQWLDLAEQLESISLANSLDTDGPEEYNRGRAEGFAESAAYIRAALSRSAPVEAK